jgi:hypothetical protein
LEVLLRLLRLLRRQGPPLAGWIGVHSLVTV